MKNIKRAKKDALPQEPKEVRFIRSRKYRFPLYSFFFILIIILQVLLRIYGRTHGEQALETVLTDTVVFTLLSERKLGPKLHGIFPGGRIEQYIPVIISHVYLIAQLKASRSRKKEIEKKIKSVNDQYGEL